MEWPVPIAGSRRPTVFRRLLTVTVLAAAAVLGVELLVSRGVDAAAGPESGGYGAVGAFMAIFFYGPVWWLALVAALLLVARVRPLFTTWAAVSVTGALGIIVSRHLLGPLQIGRAHLARPTTTGSDAVAAALFAAFAALATAAEAPTATRRAALAVVVMMAAALVGVWVRFALS